MTESATAIAAAVRAGTMTAREATEQALLRIEKDDLQVDAFQVVRAAAALSEADAIDARADKADLPLAGVPIAIKDNVPVAGEPMRSGTTASDPTPQSADHPVVARLRAAGAVVVGLTRVPELCVFGATDSDFGITRNPWDPARTPGGSSGGSAAAVAAGMVPLAHGNDGMGSIRIPSACCGLVGIKPGLGLVPAGLGNGSWFDMAENGPLATTVQDCATALSVMAGQPGLAELTDPSRVRIAVATKAPMIATPVDAQWRQAAADAAAALREAGHDVADVAAPYTQSMLASELLRWFAGTEMDARALADRSRLGRRTRVHAALGRAALRAGLPRPAGRDKWRRHLDDFFGRYDVLLTPTLAQPPKPAQAWSRKGWFANLWSDSHYAPFCAPWNLAGWPAIAVPAGLHSTGTPLSVQLVTRPGGEALLLGLAAQLEQRRPWPLTADPAARPR